MVPAVERVPAILGICKFHGGLGSALMFPNVAGQSIDACHRLPTIPARSAEVAMEVMEVMEVSREPRLRSGPARAGWM